MEERVAEHNKRVVALRLVRGHSLIFGSLLAGALVFHSPFSDLFLLDIYAFIAHGLFIPMPSEYDCLDAELDNTMVRRPPTVVVDAVVAHNPALAEWILIDYMRDATQGTLPSEADLPRWVHERAVALRHKEEL